MRSISHCRPEAPKKKVRILLNHFSDSNSGPPTFLLPDITSVGQERSPMGQDLLAIVLDGKQMSAC